MCLFLTALLRDGRIDIDEYRIEIRGFCVNFLWVVEAADVSSPWKSNLTLVISTNFELKLRVYGEIFEANKYDIGCQGRG